MENIYDLCACGLQKTRVSKECWSCHSVGIRLLERLVALDTDECVEWQRYRNRDTGYGTLNYKGRKHGTHRVAWILTNGPLASGVHVLHRCDNRACVNHRHLFLGTNAENVADMMAKGRQARGSRSGSSRLTEASAADIRRRANAGETRSSLASIYGVSRQAINDIVWRRTWKHVGS